MANFCPRAAKAIHPQLACSFRKLEKEQGALTISEEYNTTMKKKLTIGYGKTKNLAFSRIGFKSLTHLYLHHKTKGKFVNYARIIGVRARA